MQFIIGPHSRHSICSLALQHVNLRKESKKNHGIHCMQSLREKPATVRAAAAAAMAAGGSGEVRWGTSNKKVVAVAEGED
jgi:hypothetical protein